VLDTNVLVSALLKPAGNEGRVLEMVLEGSLLGVISAAMLHEYRLVLSRPKFKFDPQRVRILLRRLLNVCVFVSPAQRRKVSPDEDDNRFLECAETGPADYLVTGNLRHYPASYGTVQVLSAAGLLTALEPAME